MATRDKQLSVYPGDQAALALGGYSTSAFNQALRCWASLMSWKLVELAGQLQPEEWQFLSDALYKPKIDPALDSPGDLIAQTIEGRHSVDRIGEEHFGENADSRVQELAKRLKRMQYTTAWAILGAIQFYYAHKETIKPGDPWWTIQYRKMLAGKQARRRRDED